MKYHCFDRMDKIVSEASERPGSKKFTHGEYTEEIENLISESQEPDEEVRALMNKIVTSCRLRRMSGQVIADKLKKIPNKNTKEKDIRIRHLREQLATIEKQDVRVKSEQGRTKTIARNRAFNSFAAEFMLNNCTFEDASNLLSEISNSGRFRADVRDLDQRLTDEFLKKCPQYADLSVPGRWHCRPTMKTLLTARVSNVVSSRAFPTNERWRSFVDVVTTEANRVGDPAGAALLESNENSEPRMDRASLLVGEESALIEGALLSGEIMEVDVPGAASGRFKDDNNEVRCLGAECMRRPLLCLRPDCAVWLQEGNNDHDNGRGSDPDGEEEDGCALEDRARGTDDGALPPVPAPLPAPPASLSCPP